MAVLIFCFFSQPSFAGFVEVGGSVNYKKTSIDENNYSDSLSYTGSVSYYFWERSALELSYTSGTGKLSTKADGLSEIQQIQIAQFTMTSLDLVLSLAGKQDPIQPYFKIGAGYVEKKFFKQNELEGRVALPSQYGAVPSAGVGIKIALTQSLSLKVGIDAWTSPLNDKSKDSDDQERKLEIDYAGQAGLSWMF